MIDLAAKPVLEVLPDHGRDLPPPGEPGLWEQRGAGAGGTDLSRAAKPSLVHPWWEQCWGHQQHEACVRTLLPLSSELPGEWEKPWVSFQ